jgi:hypothetical protein
MAAGGRSGLIDKQHAGDALARLLETGIAIEAIAKITSR